MGLWTLRRLFLVGGGAFDAPCGSAYRLLSSNANPYLHSGASSDRPLQIGAKESLFCIKPISIYINKKVSK